MLHARVLIFGQLRSELFEELVIQRRKARADRQTSPVELPLNTNVELPLRITERRSSIRVEPRDIILADGAARLLVFLESALNSLGLRSR